MDEEDRRKLYTARIRRKDAFLLNDLFNPVTVEVKEKKRSGKCLRATNTSNTITYTVKEYNYIPDDIWYLVAEHIRPEDVKCFALICRQSACVVASARFWFCLYERYKPHCKSDLFRLPEDLRPEAMREPIGLRSKTIRTLFLCYPTLGRRAQFGYKLNAICGKRYVSSWVKKCSNAWLMFYKFVDFRWAKQQKITSKSVHITLVEDWESIAIDSTISTQSKTFINKDEGVTILVVYCKFYKPFPNHLLYGDFENFTLKAARQMLSSDLRQINLELDFCNSMGDYVNTITYPSILKFDVLPWWHPKFNSLSSL